MAKEAIIREYSDGENISRQGATADRLFVLRSGAVRATVTPELEVIDADIARLSRGHQIAVYDKTGDMLAVESALTGHNIDSLFAQGQTVIAEVPVDAMSILSMIEEDAEFGLSLARTLSRRLINGNKAMDASQRTASRYQRDFQGLCTDYYNLVHRIQEDAEGEDDILQALSVAKRAWSYSTGEKGGAEVTKNTRRLMARAVDDHDMIGAQHRLKKGDLLCRRGDPGDSVYLLVSGRLLVKIKNKVYGEVRPGETVGENAVLLKEEAPKRMADIEADEPSLVGVIPAGKFPDLVKAQPKLLINICRLQTVRAKSFEQLAADSVDALRGVQKRFGADVATFVADSRAMKSEIERLVEELDVPLFMEIEQLERMIERWEKRFAELQAELSHAGV
ncbi:MAG: cyclic nucleotide-binding domain-containing protein [Planctomycetes bacterium]|nr:cyclic nucleotide-binding domain-containing protein [Planctomycetota bacterium]